METIASSATLRFAKISPQKTRLVADLVRGLNVEKAKRILAFTPKKGAGLLLKLLNSAIANAEVAKVDDPEILKIETIEVNQGPVQRRHRPRARGRVDTLRRPTSHVTIVVREDATAKEAAITRLAEIEAKKAKKRAARSAKKTAETKETAKTKKSTKPADKAADEKPAAKKAVAKKPAAKKESSSAGKAPAEKKATAKKKATKKKEDGK